MQKKWKSEEEESEYKKRKKRVMGAEMAHQFREKLCYNVKSGDPIYVCNVFAAAPVGPTF